jgi:hypothetical protein
MVRQKDEAAAALFQQLFRPTTAFYRRAWNLAFPATNRD